MCTRDLYTLRAPLICIVFDHDLPRQYKNSRVTIVVRRVYTFIVVCDSVFNILYYYCVYIMLCALHYCYIICLEGKTRNIRFIRIKIIIMHILQPR